MATLIRAAGTRREVYPSNGTFFTQDELKRLITGKRIWQSNKQGRGRGKKEVAPETGHRPLESGTEPGSAPPLPGSGLVCGPTRVPGVMVVFGEGVGAFTELNTAATILYAKSEERLVYGDALVGSELEVSCLEAERGNEMRGMVA